MFKKIMIVAAGLGFLGFMAVPIIGLFDNSSSQQTSQSSVPNPNQPQLNEAKRKELEAQAEGYSAVLEREPENTTALGGLAIARLELGDWQGALDPLEKLATAYPDQPGIWGGIAQAQMNLQNWQAALEPLEKLLQQYPEQPQIWQNLATVKIRLGDLPGAIAATEKLVELNPNEPTYQTVLSQLKQQAGGTNPETENPAASNSPIPLPVESPLPEKP